MKEQTKFKNKTIAQGYAIAIVHEDDSKPYSGDDPCLYLTKDNKWGGFAQAEHFPNEAVLAVNLDDAQKAHPDVTVIPIYWRSNIDTIDSESFYNHLLQKQRAVAMAKLNNEDMVALGLMGASK